MLGVHTTKAVGEQKVVVILVDFTDVKPTFSKEQKSDRIFVDLDKYFRDSSYGIMWLGGKVIGPYLLPGPLAQYNVSIHNLEADRTKITALVRDAANAADRDVNFAQYAHVIVIVGASSAQFTGVSYCAIPGMLGNSAKVTTKSGQTISSVSVFSEDCYLGNFAHDTIHMLGGIIGGSRVTPCLYDQDLQALPGDFRGLQYPLIHMGFWDPLSCHVFKPEMPPTGLSAWTKMRLGWIEPSKIAMVNPGQTTSVTIGPLESTTSPALVIKIPLTPKTFYLVENRQKVGFGQYDPSAGILISYGDDGYEGECRHGQGPVQLMDANPNVPYLVGAAFEIGKKEVFKDTQTNLAIVLVRKVDLSYEIKITTPDKVGAAPGSIVFPSFPDGFQRMK